MSKQRVQTVAEQFANKHATEVTAAKGAARQSVATDDPLRPILKMVEKKDNITIHYETTPPSNTEIATAQKIAKRTGEDVHCLATRLARSSTQESTVRSAIRPTIVDQSTSAGANAGSARFASQDALIKATKHGIHKLRSRSQCRARQLPRSRLPGT